MSDLTTEAPLEEEFGGRCTLGDWLDEWLGLCSLRGLRQTTIEGYRRVLELYVSSSLRESGLGDIQPRQLNALYAQLLTGGRRYGRGGLSARTVRFVHTVLNGAFTDAVRHGLIDRNPAAAADPPSRRASQAPVFRTWTPEELRHFLAAVQNDPWYPALHLAASTGLRRGELLGLRWADLDLESAELQVIQTVVQIRWEAQLSTPKTPKSRRRVALDRHTVDVLRLHLVAIQAKSRGQRLDATSLAFPSPTGGPMNPDLFSAHFQRLVRKSGLPRIRLHDLRHSHATHALAAGVNPKVVAERLGHASVVITLDTYSHVFPTLQREAAEVVASLVAESGPLQGSDA